MLLVVFRHAGVNSSGTILLPLTLWTTDAPFDATELPYDASTVYDSSTTLYDGANFSLLIPSDTQWTAGTAPLLSGWSTLPQALASLVSYDSSAYPYDSSTVFYDGITPPSAPETTKWTSV